MQRHIAFSRTARASFSCLATCIVMGLMGGCSGPEGAGRSEASQRPQPTTREPRLTPQLRQSAQQEMQNRRSVAERVRAEAYKNRQP